MYGSDRPNNNSPLALFEYSVKKVISLGLIYEKNTHQSWANYIFDYEKKASVRSELMSTVKHEFTRYFDENTQYMFLEKKIRNVFPHLFGLEEEMSLFERILRALDVEYTEQKDPKNRKIYKVLSCDYISTQNGQQIYKVQLDLKEDDDPHFSEGMPIDFKSHDSTNSCEVIEFDYANAWLFLSSNRPIHTTIDAHVVSDATMNTIALIELLQEISQQIIAGTNPLHKFLNHTTWKLADIPYESYPPYLDEILSKDESQYEAFKAALSKDITFIWGPPGTGKSYTLAAIIMALYQMKGEHTAVCCLSNVAVDQLVEKVVKIIEVYEPDMERGEFYRAGRTQNENLIKTEFLFPDDPIAQNLRTKIKWLIGVLDTFKKNNLQFSDKAIQIKAQLKDARETLKKHTDYLINQVKVVFSTISNFVINPKLKDTVFDNVIIDEASMLALPQLIALTRKVTKRIILVGDFQQLSPITLTGIPILKNNVFKLCGIDIEHTSHPALHQLLNQRRSNPKLVDIINHSFYADRLVAKNNKNHPIVARAPYSGCVIGMYSVTEGAVRFTKGGTRQNTANADAIMKLLDLYSEQEEETFDIGIITPYTGQVALLKSSFIRKKYNTDFQDRVKIGTVHTFQGSECDVIIFDMVDCSKFEKGKKSYFGKIYAGTQGEQLLNVAISRAKHKLIIVCDPDYLSVSPGGIISNKTQSIFNNLLKARWTQI